MVQSDKSGICEGERSQVLDALAKVAGTWGPVAIYFSSPQVQVCFLIPNTSHRAEEKCRHAPMSFPDVVQTQKGKTVPSSELICFGITERLMH